jgi:hypothetical protein
VLSNSGLIKRLGPDHVQIFLPMVGPLTSSRPAELELRFPVDVPTGALTILCQGTELKVELLGRRLLAQLPLTDIAPDLPVLTCDLEIADLDFGQRIPSDTLELYVRPISVGG